MTLETRLLFTIAENLIFEIKATRVGSPVKKVNEHRLNRIEDRGRNQRIIGTSAYGIQADRTDNSVCHRHVIVKPND